MTITWEALVALTALVGAVLAALLWAVNQMIASALLAFEHRFFDRLNGRYIKADLCATRHQEVDRRLQAIEEG